MQTTWKQPQHSSIKSIDQLVNCTTTNEKSDGLNTLLMNRFKWRQRFHEEDQISNLRISQLEDSSGSQPTGRPDSVSVSRSDPRLHVQEVREINSRTGLSKVSEIQRTGKSMK